MGKDIEMKKGLGKGLSALVPDTYHTHQRPQSSAIAVVDAPPQAGPAVRELDIALITPNKEQPRQHFAESAIEELAASIREKGIIQPLIVSQRGDSQYEIVCGERRYRAACKADLKKVPVVIKDVDEAELLELAIIENVQREDLNPIEEARAYQKLQEERGYTHEQIAQKVGKDRVTISNALRLLKLPFDVLDLVIQKKLSEGHARAILGIPHEEQQRYMAQKVIADALSVRQTEKLIQQKAFKKRPAKAARRLDNDIIQLEDMLQKKLGTKVRVMAGKNNKGRLEIQYKSLDELDRLLDLIGVYRT